VEGYWIEKLCKVGRLLFLEGLVDARAGNLSCVLGGELLITRRGSHLGKLSPWDFIKVPLEGGGILDDRASSELLVHREVYLNTDHKSLVHAHPTSAVVLSFERDIVEPIDSEGRELIGRVEVLPPFPSGSKELALAVSQALKRSKVVLVKGHGAFSADKDPFYAYCHISVLERSCKILLHARGLQGL